jgi:hypothetical protein
MSGWVLGGNEVDGFDEEFEACGGSSYERLVRDDGLVLGCILRFERDAPTYAHVIGRRLGAFRNDKEARAAVERALEETSA